MTEYIKSLIVLLAFILSSFLVHAHQVIGISDGDTMTLLVDSKPLKIRLANIDAPESRQAFGKASKASLSDICWGKDATFETQTIDRYGRTVATVYCDGIEANREQVKRGFAWAFLKYLKDKSLIEIEKQARDAKLGLWIDTNAMPPWGWRKNKQSH